MAQPSTSLTKPHGTFSGWTQFEPVTHHAVMLQGAAPGPMALLGEQHGA